MHVLNAEVADNLWTGEMGIYYEDLYPLVKPLHDHAHEHEHANGRSVRRPPRLFAFVRVHSPTIYPQHTPSAPHSQPARPSQVPTRTPIPSLIDPIIPPINTYGTLSTHTNTLPTATQHLPRTFSLSSTSTTSSDGDCASSVGDDTRPLLPTHALARRSGVMGDLIPFVGVFAAVLRFLRLKAPLPAGSEAGTGAGLRGADVGDGRSEGGSGKHRPRVAGGGENVPLEVVRALTSWLAVLEERGSVYGASLLARLLFSSSQCLRLGGLAR